MADSYSYVEGPDFIEQSWKGNGAPASAPEPTASYGGSSYGNSSSSFNSTPVETDASRYAREADARFQSFMRPTGGGGFNFGGGGSFSPSGGNYGSLSSDLRAAIDSDNKAREEARKRALADRDQAITGQRNATQQGLTEAAPWKGQVDYLTQNPDVISDTIKNYLLGRVFDRIDLESSSAENLLAQRYAQTGRAMNPSVAQFIRDKATMEKASQARDIEINSALENRKSREAATQEAARYGTFASGLHSHEADAIGSYLQNTNYDVPQTATLLASLASRMG